MKKSVIFAKTFVCTMFIMATLLLMLHFVIYVLFPHFYLINTRNDLSQKADILSKDLDGLDESSVKEYIKIYTKNDNIGIFLQTATGQENDIPIDLASSIDKANTNNTIFIEERTIKLKNGKNINIQFVSSKNAESDAKEITLKFLPYSLIIGLVFSILFSYLASKIIIKPLIEVIRIANDVEKEKSTFLRSASHELKTPLAGLRITLENMKHNVGEYKDHQKYLASSLDMVDKMSNTIGEILNISSYQEWLKRPQIIQLSKEIAKISKEYEPIMIKKNLTINLQIKDERLNMSKTAFKKLFSNLISNAVKYSDQNSIIQIYVKNGWLKIENNCDPIKKSRIPALFKLFYNKEGSTINNIDNDRSSNGVGLFVVKNILDFYKIKYKFEPTKSGMVFAIELQHN